MSEVWNSDNNATIDERQVREMNDNNDCRGGTAARPALIAAVLDASEADTWGEAQLEWRTVGRAYDRAGSGVCHCGQEHLRYLFTIENTLNGRQLQPIGSTCIEQHFGAVPEMLDQLRVQRDLLDLERIVAEVGWIDLRRDLSRSRLRSLASCGVLSELGLRELTTLRNRRRPLTIDEHVRVERFLRLHVAPALGGDPELEIIDISDFARGHGAGMRGLDVPADATSVWRIGHHDGAMLAADLRGAA